MKKILVLMSFLISFTSCTEKKLKILIIGDSISIGYFPYLKQELKKHAILVHNEGNARDTGTGLDKIRECIGDENWDIIQFNWGLWDLCYRNPNSNERGHLDKINGQITTSLEKYKENLDSIVQILKHLTNARLIFVTTTYVPDDEVGRYREDAIRYNAVAKEIMKKHFISINDIYNKSITIHDKFRRDTNDVHYTKDGYKELSKLIVPTLIQEYETVLIEAEDFDDYGGWVLDPQFMDIMGSPYLIAHGIGEPVADAATTVVIPSAGNYRIFVRTIDWVARFDAPDAPGRFRLSVNGKLLKEVFGIRGDEWFWHAGGTVNLAAGSVELRLMDLTGFNGRCDAVVLTTDPSFVPPNQLEALARFRCEALGLPETPNNAGPYDLVVVGGGMAGSSTAVSAARLGLSVALIQDRPVLGGNNSSEIRVPMRGGVHWPPYPAIGGVIYELGSAEFTPDSHKEDLIRAESNIDLFLNTRMVQAQTEGQRITAVIGQNVRTGRQTHFSGQWFADCTGDGNLGFLAGADYRYGRESRDQTGELDAPDRPDNLVSGAIIKWDSRDTRQPTHFPETPWALPFTEKTCQQVTSGSWNWEAGFRWHQVGEAEKIRDHLFRAIFGNWSFLKNHAENRYNFDNRKLEWVAYILGKRESRRLLGDVILQEQDIVGQREFSDAAVVTTWSIDIHYPHPTNAKQFPGQEFLSQVGFFPNIEPYPIPYRCLYSRNIENLFMAGRNISVTHVALGSVRVMYTGGMMGEVVSMAAAVCKRHTATPRQVYTDHLDELKELMNRGVSRRPLPQEPPWKDVNFLPGGLMRQYRQARKALGSDAQGLGVHETIRKASLPRHE